MTDLYDLDRTAKTLLHWIVGGVGPGRTIVYTISDRNYAHYIPLLRSQFHALCPGSAHFLAVCLDQETSSHCRRHGVDCITPDLDFFAGRDRFHASTAGVVNHIGRQVGYYKFLVLLELTRLGFATLFTEMDVFVQRDPFPHFDNAYDLEISTHTFYPDVNIGFFHTRPTSRLLAFAEQMVSEFLGHDEWDQSVVDCLLGNGVASWLPGVEFGAAWRHGLLWRKLDPSVFAQYVVEQDSCMCDEQRVVSKHFLGIPLDERRRLLDQHYAGAGSRS